VVEAQRTVHMHLRYAVQRIVAGTLMHTAAVPNVDGLVVVVVEAPPFAGIHAVLVEQPPQHIPFVGECSEPAGITDTQRISLAIEMGFVLPYRTVVVGFDVYNPPSQGVEMADGRRILVR